MAASEALFNKLADALGQPSKAYRAAQAGLSIPESAITGYLQGKERGQELSKYKVLNTRLGDIFKDPSSIPGGLGPDHTVSDLMQLAPVLPYVPTEAGGNIANMMMGADSTPPAYTQTPGAKTLSTDQGTSAPQSVATFGNATSTPTPSPSTPRIGKMSMNDIQKYGPLLNDVRQGRQFQQGQAAEESRFNRGKTAEESRFERGQSAEESRFQRGKMAGVAETASKNLTNTGTIQDDINNLRTLFKGYQPTPFVGGIGARVAAASGSPTFGTKTMQQGNAINQVAPALGAKVNYELTHRFSPGESELLMNNVAPSATDNEVNANRKLNNLQRLVSVFQSGDQNSISMVASAITGKPVVAQVPTSAGASKANSSNDPLGIR